MDWTFVKLIDTRFEKPMEYPWLLKVDSVDTLEAYETVVQGPRMVEAFKETVKSREFLEAIDSPEYGDHSRNHLTYPLILKATNNAP